MRQNYTAWVTSVLSSPVRAVVATATDFPDRPELTEKKVASTAIDESAKQVGGQKMLSFLDKVQRTESYTCHVRRDGLGASKSAR